MSETSAVETATATATTKAEADDNKDDDKGPILVGGTRKEPAYCLLDGMVDDQGKRRPFQLPIDRLPASLGRTHVPTDVKPEHFFGLGKVKALSRMQCLIEYRTRRGTIGPLGDPTLDTYQDPELTKPNESVQLLEDQQQSQQQQQQQSQDMDDDQGFFVLTCLGKNPIRVNGKRLEQNESCVLHDGAAVRISAFMLYFFHAQPDPDRPPKTLLLPDPDGENTTNPRRSTKKRQRPSLDTVSNAEPTLAKRLKGNAWHSIQEQLDQMSTDELLRQLELASHDHVWDRRSQFMGATVAYRAVREAARAPEIQQKAADGGVAKSDVVEWIQQSPRFQDWTALMQTKLEPKSYQSSISKAMTRAGYERINHQNFGRFVRWYLPADCHDNPNRHQIYLDSQQQQVESSKAEKSKEGGGDAGGGKGTIKKEGGEEEEAASETENQSGTDTPLEQSGTEQDEEEEEEEVEEEEEKESAEVNDNEKGKEAGPENEEDEEMEEEDEDGDGDDNENVDVNEDVQEEEEDEDDAEQEEDDAEETKEPDLDQDETEKADLSGEDGDIVKENMES